MRVLRFTIPAVLFAVLMVGCIVQADTYSDQNPFSAPDTLQSGGDMSVQGLIVNPKPIGILTSTPEPTMTSTPEPTMTSTPEPTAAIDKDDYIPTATPEYQYEKD